MASYNIPSLSFVEGVVVSCLRRQKAADSPEPAESFGDSGLLCLRV